MFRRTPRRAPTAVAWAMALLAALATTARGETAAAAGQAKQIVIEKDFRFVAPIKIKPLVFHDGAVQAEWQRLIDREVDLVDLESSLAGDLAAYASLADNETDAQQKMMGQLISFYKGMADKSGLKVDWAAVSKGAAWRWTLIKLGTAVSREINAVATKRRELETKYFDGISTVPKAAPAATPAGEPAGGAPKAAGKAPFFLMDAGMQRRITDALRARLLSIRSLRQGTVENVLIATNRARGGLPVAGLEGSIEWLTTYNPVDELNKKIDAATLHIRDLRVELEVSKQIARQHLEQIAFWQKRTSPNKGKAIQRLQDAIRKLGEDAAAAEKDIKAEQAKIDKWKEQIKKYEEGLEATKKEWEARDVGGAGKIASFGNLVSSSYAELTFRRRRHARATFEAAHLYGLAEKFALVRRGQYLAEQINSRIVKGKVVAADAAPDYKPILLRQGYIDQGLVALLDRELKAENAFLGQLDYFNGLWAAYQDFGGKMEGTRWAKVTKWATDTAQMLMGAVSGASSVVLDQVTELANKSQDWYHFKTEADGLHKKVIEARGGIDKQLKLLEAAVEVADDQLAATLLPRAAQDLEKWQFVGTKPPEKQDAHDLFKDDREFYDKLDGGPRRIVSSINTTRDARMFTEYLIAYEKAGFTLRDLQRIYNSKIGLKANEGTVNWNLLLSPVNAYVTAETVRYSLLFDLEVKTYLQTRQQQVERMRLVYPLLKEVGFDLGELYRRRKEDNEKVQWHWALWLEHPDYRRFWHKVLQEQSTEAQQEALAQKKKAAGWWEENQCDEKLEASIAAAPAPDMLARAHYQDALDYIQCLNYPAALSSLLQANELDAVLVPQLTVMDMENQMAWYEAGSRAYNVGSTIGDAIVWYIVTQGMLGHLGLVEGIQPLGMDFVYGQFLPLYGFVPYQTVIQRGVLAALPGFLTKAGMEFGQKALREEVLVGIARLDPQVADRIASLIWAVVEKYQEKAGERLANTWLYKRGSLFFLCRRLKQIKDQMEAGGKAAPDDILKVLSSQESSWFELWKARRRAGIIIEAVELSAQAAKLMDELGIDSVKALKEKLHQPPKAGAEPEGPEVKARKAEEAERELAAVMQRRKQLLLLPSPEVLQVVIKVDNFDPAIAESIYSCKLEGKARDDAIEAAGVLLRRFDGLYPELGSALTGKERWAGKEELRTQILDTFDNARRVIHHESFGNLIRSAGTDNAKKLMKDAAELWAAKHPDAAPGKNPFEGPKALTAERLKVLADGIMAVVPTGSGGYIRLEGGEYKKWASDLDFTIVMKNEVDVSPAERVAVEFLTQSSFRQLSGGLNPDSFDMAYMVDGADVVRARSVELKSPSEVIETLKNGSPEDRAKYLKALGASYEDLLVNAPHGERYLSPDRIMALVWLNSLGQDILVRDPKGSGFIRRRKADVLADPNAGQEIVGLIKNPKARLDRWMAFGIAVDDLGFLGKKLPKLTQELFERPGNREPMDNLVKELDKRSIRVLLAFISSDPQGCAELNALGERAHTERVDHSTICEVGIRVVQRMAREGGVGNLDYVQSLLQSWSDVKLGLAKGSDLVERRFRSRGQEPPDPNSEAYRQAFLSEVNSTAKVLEFLGKKAMRAGSEELTPLFEYRNAQLRASTDANATAAARETAAECLKGVDQDIQYRITSMASWYQKLGGHLGEGQHDENVFKKTFREAYLKAGANKDDVRRAFKAAGVPEAEIDKAIQEFPDAPQAQPQPQPQPGAFLFRLDQRPFRLSRRVPFAVPAALRAAA